MAQRLVRAKAKIRDARHPLPGAAGATSCPSGSTRCCAVVYLVFNEGYAATAGRHARARASSAAEAIRLGRLLVELLPEPEAAGLLALMLLHDARRAARDRRRRASSCCSTSRIARAGIAAQIAEGLALVERGARVAPRRARTRSRPRSPPCTREAARRRGHRLARRSSALYDVLLRLDPSPVVALNRAVAVAMRDGPAAGLALVEAVAERRASWPSYSPAHAARAELCRRLGRTDDARAVYARALALSKQAPERRFIERRLRELGGL